MMGDGVGLLIATSNSEGLHNILSHLKIYVDYPLCYSLISVISLIRQLLLIPQNLLSRSVKDITIHYNSMIIIMGVTEVVCELKALKTKIEGVFSASCCCYGYLLCHENDYVFANDWPIF